MTKAQLITLLHDLPDHGVVLIKVPSEADLRPITAIHVNDDIDPTETAATWQYFATLETTE